MGAARRDGFTLLEVLLTAVLISVVMVVVASVFSGGVQIWSRGEEASQQHQQIRFLRYKLGLDLRNAVPYRPIPVEGEAGRLRLVLAERSKTETKVLSEVQYQVETLPQGQRLARTSISLETGEEKKEFLLERSQIRFFYPYRGEKGELLWQEAWTASPETGDFPRWVKAEILLEKGISPSVQIFSMPRGSVTEAKGETAPASP